MTRPSRQLRVPPYVVQGMIYLSYCILAANLAVSGTTVAVIFPLYRQAASGAAGKFDPLQKWHAKQLQRQQQAAVQAERWWGSKDRLKVAVLGATGMLKHSKLHSDNSSNSTAASAASAGGTGSKSQTGGRGSKGSNSAGMWPPGDHDSHPQCPLCKKEQQQQQQRDPMRQVGASSATKSRSTSSGNSGGGGSSSGSRDGHGGGGGSSSSSGPYTGWAVPYDDPFLWRRLMWQLLGKLSPEAQAFYSTYLAMCPHATDRG